MHQGVVIDAQIGNFMCQEPSMDGSISSLVQEILNSIGMAITPPIRQEWQNQLNTTHKYWFEQQHERVVKHSDAWYRNKLRQNKNYQLKKPYQHNFPIPKYPDKKNKRCVWEINTKPYSEAHFAVYPEKLCAIPIKAGCPERGIVLDPFFGSGTTGLVAKNLLRNYIGIELNEDYIKIANKRLAQGVLDI